MNENLEGIFNILIGKGFLFSKRIKKEIVKIFLNKNEVENFAQEFIKEKEFFLEDIQNALDTNPKFEALKYVNKNDTFFCYRYKKKNKNVRSIFFVYMKRIILLDVFYEDSKKSYKKAIDAAVVEYNKIVNEGEEYEY